MNMLDPNRPSADHVVVIGAGFGGLGAALLLRAAGYQVTVIERHGWVGGKARAVPSAAGPVDAGPTVLTMRHVFDDIFKQTGVALKDFVTLTQEPLLARHFWRDGSTLDFFADRAESASQVAKFAGPRAAEEFRAFAEEAEELFDLFDAPMMQAAEPSLPALARAALSSPRHLATLSPLRTLATKLSRSFSDPRLRQLFGRYATYVGGAPGRSPALLSLIWRAEEAGVWRVAGGMHKLAEAMAERLRVMGGQIRCGVGVARVLAPGGTVNGVCLEDGTELQADRVVFNGDPRALGLRLLGSDVAEVAPATQNAKRSLSARVWSFAAEARGPKLAHHNVFFAETPNSEFAAIEAGHFPQDPTLYVCAEDRGSDRPEPEGQERFEIILNAAPLTDSRTEQDEATLCHQVTFPTLARFGLTFTPEPEPAALATPSTYETLFPGSAGSLYGQSPHGITAALKRPRARTPIRGLYLAGGGTHPGAGVPMAALSGRHAAEAIEKDRVLT